MSGNALAHHQKCLACTMHFLGAAWPELTQAAARSEVVRRLRQTQDGAYLIAQKYDGDGEQYERRQHHPDEQCVGAGGINAALICQHTEDYAFVSLDANVHKTRMRHCVDPERAVAVVVQISGKTAIDEREQRRVDRRRQLARNDLQLQLEPAGGQGFEFFLGGRAPVRILVHVDEQPHVSGERPRQHAGDIVPMAVEDNAGHDRLQHHNRRDKNDQRPLIKPRWKVTLENGVELCIDAVEQFHCGV